jgi:hypothetical protein
MRALGRANLPGAIEIGGNLFRLARTVKHDFFAATGFYEDAGGRRIVLKMGRVVDFAGMPLLWLGKLLQRRELGFYRKLKDVPAVPKVLGTLGPTGFLLEFVEGVPLTAMPRCPDHFFGDLQSLFDELHRRNIAYVDTDKSQNILLGSDGKPHLIDFQISFDADAVPIGPLVRLLLRQFRQSDTYHLLKHKKRLRPDQLTEDEHKIVERRSLPIRIHRFISKPYFDLRRTTFRRLRETGRLLPEGSK